MIFFRPVVSAENQNEITFEALENEQLLGSCTMLIDGNKALINAVDVISDNDYIIDGLIKSAFNYACIKNCYMGYCSCSEISTFLDKMNFNRKDGLYYNDIPSVLQGNCCKKA